MKEIDGTVVMNGDWINLDVLTGLTSKNLPIKIRDANEPITHVDSYNYLVNDPTCDPRYYEVAVGANKIAVYYGVTVQYFNRYIRPTLNYLRGLGVIPVTNVSSAYADGLRHQQETRLTRCNNLRVKPTDCSSGTN